jgi:hypothetical protein
MKNSEAFRQSLLKGQKRYPLPPKASDKSISSQRATDGMSRTYDPSRDSLRRSEAISSQHGTIGSTVGMSSRTYDSSRDSRGCSEAISSQRGIDGMSRTYDSSRDSRGRSSVVVEGSMKRVMSDSSIGRITDFSSGTRHSTQASHFSGVSGSVGRNSAVSERVQTAKSTKSVPRYTDSQRSTSDGTRTVFTQKSVSFSNDSVGSVGKKLMFNSDSQNSEMILGEDEQHRVRSQSISSRYAAVKNPHMAKHDKRRELMSNRSATTSAQPHHSHTPEYLVSSSGIVASHPDGTDGQEYQSPDVKKRAPGSKDEYNSPFAVAVRMDEAAEEEMRRNGDDVDEHLTFAYCRTVAQNVVIEYMNESGGNFDGPDLITQALEALTVSFLFLKL